MRVRKPALVEPAARNTSLDPSSVASTDWRELVRNWLAQNGRAAASGARPKARWYRSLVAPRGYASGDSVDAAAASRLAGIDGSGPSAVAAGWRSPLEPGRLASVRNSLRTNF